MDVRNLYPDSRFADLHNELTMPSELRKAYMQNDKAVMQEYGFTKLEGGRKKWLLEDECVSELMKRYQEMTIV